MDESKFFLISYGWKRYGSSERFESMSVWKGSIASWVHKNFFNGNKEFTIINTEEITSEEYDFLVNIVG
jgi:hypothetical protein